eukprot:comp19131_c3_seq1/m.21776 comp19131_c3_seq1/g.21776  ORF comp19131_c3_seq1/g.21776 comp19131_c3_seq1/m.21776 type:complete len:168 (-) comp19131_c3_seq1:200-703(-)
MIQTATDNKQETPIQTPAPQHSAPTFPPTGFLFPPALSSQPWPQALLAPLCLVLQQEGQTQTLQGSGRFPILPTPKHMVSFCAKYFRHLPLLKETTNHKDPTPHRPIKMQVAPGVGIITNQAAIPTPTHIPICILIHTQPIPTHTHTLIPIPPIKMRQMYLLVNRLM